MCRPDTRAPQLLPCLPARGPSASGKPIAAYRIGWMNEHRRYAPRMLLILLYGTAARIGEITDLAHSAASFAPAGPGEVPGNGTRPAGVPLAETTTGYLRLPR